MKLWGKKMMENCLGDLAILLANLEASSRSKLLSNILKLNENITEDSKSLKTVSPLQFVLEHTWLVFACPLQSDEDMALFKKVTEIYRKILHECVQSFYEGIRRVDYPEELSLAPVSRVRQLLWILGYGNAQVLHRRSQ